jgi:hypothetical protein
MTSGVRIGTLLAAVANVVLGLLFLLGPELRFSVWPSPISPVLIRFIGAIILANGVGAVLAYRQGTWEGARVLFLVALVYGAILAVFLPWALLAAPGVDQSLWAYVVLNDVVTVAILLIVLRMERPRPATGPED